MAQSTLATLDESQCPVVEEDIDNSESLSSQPSSHTSRSASETLEEPAPESPDSPSTTQKKKKKKKSKKAAKAKESSNGSKPQNSPEEDRPPVLCISRNKHWRYISSYHGPWLQLPVELLESLLILNLDPATLSAPDTRPTHALPSPSFSGSRQTPRSRGFASVSDHSSPDSPHNAFANLPPPPPLPLPLPKPGKATPPPIDPGVFRSVTQIRRLIDEASELSVRASSGLSAVALGSLRGGGMYAQNPWASTLGVNGLNDGGSGRNVPMSATRVHRLRTLAVQKLAAAYKMDEIASSVMVMQGGSVFDDIAERVLRVDPNDADARYVHFFHEKIPSRQLAESTSTKPLDELIAGHPQRLEFFRTRGIVHCFRDEFTAATKDFTHVIREARALRKSKMVHRINGLPNDQRGKGMKKKKGKGGVSKTNGQAPPNGTSTPMVIPEGPTIDGPDGEPLLLHPSVLPDAPDPIEPQCLFLRGAAYLQQAAFLIEEAILKLEGVRKAPTSDGTELRLCNLDGGKYGGVEIKNPDGPLGNKNDAKLKAYRAILANNTFREQIVSLVKKALRDHEKFLSHFDTLEGLDEEGEEVDLAQKVERAYHICENLRPNGQHPPPPMPNTPVMFTTYHPLLVESHFSVLICQLMLGDFVTLVRTFSRAALLVDGLEGYPIFLPPRSMSQAEFIEVLERLAGGWKNGIQPHSFCRVDVGSGLTIETYKTSAKAKEVDRAGTPPTPSSTSSEFSAVPLSASASASSSSSIATLIGINGSSSSSVIHPSASFSSIPPTSSGRETPVSNSDRYDLVEALDCARMLLVPVAARQEERKSTALVTTRKSNGTGLGGNANGGGKKKPLSINIPLHGPRVDILLAWLGAVHLVELDSVA